MTLSGGKADDLNLSDFIDAGYALLVEAYQSAPGGHLVDALEKAREYAEGEDPEKVKEESVERKNEQSLAQLEKMMRGVR